MTAVNSNNTQTYCRYLRYVKLPQILHTPEYVPNISPISPICATQQILHTPSVQKYNYKALRSKNSKVSGLSSTQRFPETARNQHKEAEKQKRRENEEMDKIYWKIRHKHFWVACGRHDSSFEVFSDEGRYEFRPWASKRIWCTRWPGWAFAWELKFWGIELQHGNIKNRPPSQNPCV